MSKDKRKPVQTPINEDTAKFAEKFDTAVSPTRVQESAKIVEPVVEKIVEKVVEKIRDPELLDRHNRIKSDLRTVNSLMSQMTVVGGTASMSGTEYIRVQAALERINEALSEG